MDSELTQLLWALLTNPNVAYVLLLIGLWAAAAAFYVPGTGLLEATAIICLALAITGLTQQPINVTGLVLIVVAGVLLVVDLKVQSVALTLVAAASLVLGSIFLFPPTKDMPRLSPWLIGGITLASLSFFGVALSAAARTRRMRAKVSTETMIGQRGIVVTTLDPVGTVQVQSELWTAVASENSPIDVGQEVEVTGLQGLKVCVERVKEGTECLED